MLFMYFSWSLWLGFYRDFGSKVFWKKCKMSCFQIEGNWEFWCLSCLSLTIHGAKAFQLFQTVFQAVCPYFKFLALVLSFPLLITSNNYSVKKLGKMWKVLHRLVYPIMFLLVLHTAMQGRDFQILELNFGIDYTLSYALPSLIILILQITSHFYAKKR